MWGDSGRLVHRKVEHSAEAGADEMLRSIAEQFAADRTAMAQLYGAIQAVAKVVNKHDDGMSSLETRLEEGTRMRLDDHRLHIGAINHVRAGVGDLGRSNIKMTEYIDAQDRASYTELEKKLQDIKDKVNEAVPILVEAKLESIKTAVDKLHSTEEEMKAYLIELEKARPGEGRMGFGAFKDLKQEVAEVKAMANGLSSATAAGLNGLAASGMTTGLSAAHASMLDTMKAQVEALVIAEQARPCHCGDVDSNTARIAYIEAQVGMMQAEAAAWGTPATTAGTGTAAATLFTLNAGGAPGNGAARSGDGLPPYLKTAAGGNGSCHCRCV
jgi:hypothetical protein